MYSCATRFYPLMLVPAILFFYCSPTAPVPPSELLQGNCVGIVRDADGSPAKNASILLVPELYLPGAGSVENGIDSTISDEYGRYAFTIGATGGYNLLSKSRKLYAMHQPVRISTNARVIMDDVILTEPGSISGQIRLQGMSDHHSAIVLFVGTTIYTMPSDSTGAFTVAALAEGSYNLRVLTAESGFAVVETTVVVASGRLTTLPCIELPANYVPTIDSLAVNYNSAMNMVTLSWPPLDTANIKGYNIYCNRTKSLDPVATLRDSETTTTFDIILSTIDTFSYQIAAIGNDGMEGPATSGMAFAKTSSIELIRTIHLQTPPSLSANVIPDFDNFCIDRQGNIIVTNRGIVKYDSNGTFIRQFVPSRDTGTNDSLFVAKTDAAGNVYALKGSSTSLSLMKLDDKLNVIRELPMNDDAQPEFWNFSITVSPAGTVLFQKTIQMEDPYFSGPYITYIRVYTTSLGFVRSDTIPGLQQLLQLTVGNDDPGIFKCYDTENQLIIHFDNDFNRISSMSRVENTDAGCDRSSLLPANKYLRFSYQICLVADDLFASPYFPNNEDEPTLYIFFDVKGQPVARAAYAHPFDYAYYTFDLPYSPGRSTYLKDGQNTLLKYFIEPVIGSLAP